MRPKHPSKRFYCGWVVTGVWGRCLNLQVSSAQRWRRLRGDWLRAAGSSVAGAITGTGTVAAMLREPVMTAWDDDRNCPLRYQSWFGGMVVRFL